MPTYPPGFGGPPPSDRQRARAARTTDRALRVPQPNQPGETEWIWIGTALLVVAGLIFVDFLFYGAATAFYLAMAAIVVGAGVIISMLVMPSDPTLGFARLAGLVVSGFLLWGLSSTGQPLAFMEAASGVAQPNQDAGGNVGNASNGLFVFVMTVASLALIVWFWRTKRWWLVLLLALAIPMVLIPFLGFVGQVIIYDM